MNRQIILNATQNSVKVGKKRVHYPAAADPVFDEYIEPVRQAFAAKYEGGTDDKLFLR